MLRQLSLSVKLVDLHFYGRQMVKNGEYLSDAHHFNIRPSLLN